MRNALCARLLLGLLLSLLLTAPLGAESPGAPTIAIDEVRPGMRGYGESVFVGTQVERFEVDVLGVLKNALPVTSYILARLTGHNLEKTGVIAGMSGSPVWIEGRLAGAVAFSWPFSQEAVAGITPIANMREIPSSAPWGGDAPPPGVELADLLARSIPADLTARWAAPLSAGNALGARPALGWGVSGFSETALSELGRSFPTLGISGSGRSDAQATDLIAGSAVAALFVDGDLRLAATGTVTERIDESILAFGHPLFGLGEIELPMATAEVVTVLGSDFSSFKLSNVGTVVGAFERDHAAGNLGRLGARARTVPLEVAVHGQSPRRFSMRLARVPELLGLLTAISTVGALDAVTGVAGVDAVDLDVRAGLGAAGELELEQSFDGAGAGMRAILFAASVVDFLARTDLAEIEVERVEIELVPRDGAQALEVLGAHALLPRLAPGESTEIVVELRGYRGAIEHRKLPLTVPSHLRAGRYLLMIGDGASLDAVRFALEPVEPRTFEQARALLASLGSSRELQLLGLVPAGGASAAGEALPLLPPTLQATLMGGARGRPLRAAIVQRATWREARPLAGVARLELELVRKEPMTGPNGEPAGNGQDADDRRSGEGTLR